MAGSGVEGSIGRDPSAHPGDGERRPLALIVARSRGGVIGVDGDLPWRLPADLKRFKALTLGKPCCMGRKTWDSLPFLLPGRPNLVLTRSPEFQADGAEVFTDLEAMLDAADAHARTLSAPEIMIIGGEALYAMTMGRAARLYVTDVDVDVRGDAHFPPIDPDVWRPVAAESHDADAKNAHAFVVRTWERRTRDTA